MQNDETKDRAPENRSDDCGCEEPHAKRHKFDFKVDAEKLLAWAEGDAAELTVRTVLDMSGNQPPENYYLVEFTGDGHKERIKRENLDELLKIKNEARFAAVYRGCTPVS